MEIIMDRLTSEGIEHRKEHMGGNVYSVVIPVGHGLHMEASTDGDIGIALYDADDEWIDELCLDVARSGDVVRVYRAISGTSSAADAVAAFKLLQV